MVSKTKGLHKGSYIGPYWGKEANEVNRERRITEKSSWRNNGPCAAEGGFLFLHYFSSENFMHVSNIS